MRLVIVALLVAAGLAVGWNAVGKVTDCVQRRAAYAAELRER